MVFNTGHWWTHHGKMRAWDYFQLREELTEEMEPAEAFNKALRTWARWVDRNVDPCRTDVFFHSISPEHKRENLQWCYNQTRPFSDNEGYLQLFPKSMVKLVERTHLKMRAPVRYLNVTKLSEFRRDAHTGVYTKRQGKFLTPEQRK
ncbi:protein trichome birefringence-like 1 [Zingiber officinale]|nr:protein trichome birefringence-like 1 [Zingiber officinale]